MIYSTCVSRNTTVTISGYRIVVSGGTILKQVTTTTSQDQQYRNLTAASYALVEPGTYTVTRTISGGSGLDNESIVATAVPMPFGLPT